MIESWLMLCGVCRQEAAFILPTESSLYFVRSCSGKLGTYKSFAGSISSHLSSTWVWRHCYSTSLDSSRMNSMKGVRLANTSSAWCSSLSALRLGPVMRCSLFGQSLFPTRTRLLLLASSHLLWSLPVLRSFHSCLAFSNSKRDLRGTVSSNSVMIATLVGYTIWYVPQSVPWFPDIWLLEPLRFLVYSILSSFSCHIVVLHKERRKLRGHMSSTIFFGTPLCFTFAWPRSLTFSIWLSGLDITIAMLLCWDRWVLRSPVWWVLALVSTSLCHVHVLPEG